MADEDPKSPFTDEQVASLKQLTSSIVNSALRNHITMADKKREQDREAMTAAFAKMLDDKLGTNKPNDDGANKDGKSGKGDSLKISTLETQLRETNARVEAAEKRAAEERAKNEASELRERVSTILTPFGIEGTRFKGAYALLKDRIRKQQPDDPESPHVFVDDTGEELDLAIGLKGWAKGDEAKIYVPASGAAGSGARRPAGAPPPAQKKEASFEDVGNWANAVIGSGGAVRLGE